MKCKICGSEATQSDWQKGFGVLINCNECGKYIIESTGEEIFEEKWVRNALYYYIRQLAYKDLPLMLCKDSVNTKEYEVITIEDLKNIYPQNIHERIDWILLNLYNESPDFGQQIEIDSEIVKWTALFVINNEEYGEDSLKNIVEILSDMNYLIKIRDYYDFAISYEGWKRLNILQSNKTKTKKAFIAMSFDECMDSERDAIKKAISKSGHIPILIDEKEHNNQIVPEILYEIDTCDFVVADLTGGRQGVYYEAGYGLGKGKEVILLLKNNSDDKPHFDVSQTNQIRYSSPEDLFERLVKRIEATIRI